MKIIKSVLLVSSFILSTTFYGQTNDSLKNVQSLRSNFYTNTFPSIDDPIVFEQLDIKLNAPTLVLYNRTTNLYDIYLNVNSNYSYSGSNTVFKTKPNFFTTLFLGNDSFMENNRLVPNSSLMLGENVSFIVRDSFNPNAADNFSEAVLGGVLGLIFN